MSRKAIVTIVAGERYQRNFARYCYADWKTYTDRHGLDLLVIDTLPDTSPLGLSRSAAWQKCLVMAHGPACNYEQVAWVDSDILINSVTAPNIFETVQPSEIGAVEDYAYPTREAYRARLETLYRGWEAQGIAFINNLTPELFLQSWGLKPMDRVIQTGVLVVSPELHGPLLQRTYDTYEDKGSAKWNYEMRPLSYEILTNTAVRWLDLRFNVVVCFGIKDDELNIFLEPPSVPERIVGKLHLPWMSKFFARNRKLSRVYKRLLDESYFLHFAGKQQDMALLL
jgi:hypothetical protein